MCTHIQFLCGVGDAQGAGFKLHGSQPHRLGLLLGGEARLSLRQLPGSGQLRMADWPGLAVSCCCCCFLANSLLGLASFRQLVGTWLARCLERCVFAGPL